MLAPGLIAPVLLLMLKPLGAALYVPPEVPVRVTFTDSLLLQIGDAP